MDITDLEARQFVRQNPDLEINSFEKVLYAGFESYGNRAV